MTPEDIAYKVLEDNLYKYLELDPNWNYVNIAFQQANLPEQNFSFNFNEKIYSELLSLESLLLNWLWFAKVIDKKIDDSTEEIIIDLKGEISIRISNNIYYFEKHVFSDNQTRMFAIIYPGHPKYLAFSIEIQDIINNSFDLLKCKSFQKIMKINA